MNIDVREYLRINPISVHELTVSEDAKDCFLCFPGNENSTDEYVVYMQKTIFWALNQSIFQSLIEGDEDNFQFALIPVSSVELGDDNPDDPILIERLEDWKWSKLVHLNDDQFQRYKRHFEWDDFKEDFRERTKTLETDIDNKINYIKSHAKLNYPGAVDIQSKTMKAHRQWKSSQYGLNSRGEVVIAPARNPTTPIYSNFGCGLGGIWCYSQEKNLKEGYDEVEIGTQPFLHNHKQTKAETMTSSFSSIKGGSKLVGDFTAGHKDIVSYDVKYGRLQEKILDVIKNQTPTDSDGITYPLYGQNVINWRNRKKTHNNKPPSLNVYVRYKRYNSEDNDCTAFIQRGILTSEDIKQDLKTFRDAVEKYNTAEAQYLSQIVPPYIDPLQIVPQLDDFKKDDLTTHDYLLRLIVEGNDNNRTVSLMKQTIQQFIDIFADVTANALGMEIKYDPSKAGYEMVTIRKFDDGSWILLNGDSENDAGGDGEDEGTVVEVKNLKDFVTLAQILKPKLDRELILISEFMGWYNECNEILDRIILKLQTLKELLQSVKPMTYIGRIIISTTDDTEQKVIKKYGGIRWRRVMNFLRGIECEPEQPEENPNPQEILGRKLGEEYVCLRESNIPEHTHKIQVESQETTEPSSWTCANTGGEIPQLVNADKSETEQGEMVNGIKNETLNYQISPLEYEARDSITIPHENMPPMMEVYIWECMEVSDYERDLSGEPPAEQKEICIVKWDSEGGSFTPPNTQVVPGQTLEDCGLTELYSPGTKEGYHLDEKQWYTEDGVAVTKETTVTHDSIFHAMWHKNEYTITWNSNGGKNVTQYKRKHGETLGVLPPVEREGYKLTGWYTDKSGGVKIEPTLEVTENATYYAHWTANTYRVMYLPTQDLQTAGFFVNGNPLTNATYDRAFKCSSPILEGHTFQGWNVGRGLVPETARYGTNSTAQEHLIPDRVHKCANGASGDLYFKNLTPKDGHLIVMFANWQLNTLTVFYDANGGTEPSKTQDNVIFGNTISELPTTTRTGYGLVGWYDSLKDGANKLTTSTPIKKDMTYYAIWRLAVKYFIKYNGNGATYGSMENSTYDYDQVKALSKNEFINHKYRINLNPNGEGARIEGDKNVVDVSMEFLGWATTAVGDVMYSDKQLVKNLSSINNTTVNLYAKWDNVGQVVLPAPIRPTYCPTGWYDAATGGTKKSDIGDTYVVYANEDLYAQWRPIKYYVVFSGNGNTSGTMDRQQMEYIHSATNPGVALSENKFVKQSTVTFNGNGGATEKEKITLTHNFLQWNTQANGNGTDYSNKQVVKNLASNDNDIFTIYAQWRDASLTLVGASKNGYTFRGWLNGSENVGLKGKTYSVKNNLTLKADWQPYNYEVKFNANGGKFNNGSQQIARNFNHDTPFNESEIEEPKLDNKMFGGWFTASAGGVKLTDEYVYGQDNTGNNPNYSPTFYAHWMTVVTFDDNDYNIIWTMNSTDYYMRHVSDQKVPNKYFSTELTKLGLDKNNVKKIAIRSDIETIGDSAFIGCGVSEVQLEDTLKVIENKAFKDCKNLKNINIPDGVVKVGENAFSGCNTALYATPKDGLKTVDRWICEINADNDLDLTGCSDGIIGMCDGLFSGGDIEHFKTGDNFKYIGDRAFDTCDSLRNVNIGKQVLRIGNKAFKDCKSLETVQIDETCDIEEIGTDAFNGCAKLTGFDVPKNVTVLKESTFQNCSSLKQVKLPNGLVSIGMFAFMGCESLKEIEIPETVSEIGNCAFYKCSQLTTVIVHGKSVEQIEQLAKDGWFGQGQDENQNSVKFKVCFYDETGEIVYMLNDDEST